MSFLSRSTEATGVSSNVASRPSTLDPRPSTLDGAGLLDAPQYLHIAHGRGQRNGRQCHGGRSAVEHLAVVGQHVAAVQACEPLACETVDALMVGCQH
ncbi:hypothetical protein [Insolitispirillum peregrinum]|uniref:hypothetical protein n=1 Tax=Insolitispirillum peregrinum TaxID=80876 RepID=UPI00361C9C54